MLEHAKQYQGRQIPDRYHKGNISPRRRERPKKYAFERSPDTNDRIVLFLNYADKEREIQNGNRERGLISTETDHLLSFPLQKVKSPIERRTSSSFGSAQEKAITKRYYTKR